MGILTRLPHQPGSKMRSMLRMTAPFEEISELSTVWMATLLSVIPFCLIRTLVQPARRLPITV